MPRNPDLSWTDQRPALRHKPVDLVIQICRARPRFMASNRELNNYRCAARPLEGRAKFLVYRWVNYRELRSAPGHEPHRPSYSSQKPRSRLT